MLLIYGGYQVAWAISGSAAGTAFLTDPNYMNDGRSGAGTSMQWCSGTQTTASYTRLTGTLTSPFADCVQGGIGIVNVRGLPAGTKVTLGAQSTRLVAGRRGELNAWFLPPTVVNSTSMQLTFNNDVNGVPSILPSTQFYIGSIIVGRLASWPTLLSSPPQEEIIDPTQFQRSSGGQLWQLMRKPYSQITAKLGVIVTQNALGGALAANKSGGSIAPATMDARTLMYILSTTPVCAVCAVPHTGPNNAARILTAGGFPYDDTVMQQNFMLARPTAIQPIQMTDPPYWSFAAQFQEAC